MELIMMSVMILHVLLGNNNNLFLIKCHSKYLIIMVWRFSFFRPNLPLPAPCKGFHTPSIIHLLSHYNHRTTWIPQSFFITSTFHFSYSCLSFGVCCQQFPNQESTFTIKSGFRVAGRSNFLILWQATLSLLRKAIPLPWCCHYHRCTIETATQFDVQF